MPRNNNPHEHWKVNDVADRGGVDTVQEGRTMSRSSKRTPLRQSIMKMFSIIDELEEECDQSQQKEGFPDIDRLSISAKFTTGEYDQPLLRPKRQQSLKSLWVKKSQESCDKTKEGSDKFSVASPRFGLPEEANMPIYCPMRQMSHNMDDILCASYRTNGTHDMDDILSESYRSNGTHDIDDVLSESFRSNGRFGLSEEASMPVYCPMRQMSHNMDDNLCVSYRTNGSHDMDDFLSASYRTNGSRDMDDILSASFRTDGANEPIDPISSEAIA